MKPGTILANFVKIVQGVGYAPAGRLYYEIW